MSMTQARNVLGEPLETCCTSPMTGFYRDGTCNTGGGDFGAHTVCAQMTEEFLTFTKSRGNDLSTPVPAFDFPGVNYPTLPSAEGEASNFTEECRILDLRPRIGLTSSPLALASPVPGEDSILIPSALMFCAALPSLS